MYACGWSLPRTCHQYFLRMTFTLMAKLQLTAHTWNQVVQALSLLVAVTPCYTCEAHLRGCHTAVLCSFPSLHSAPLVCPYLFSCVHMCTVCNMGLLSYPSPLPLWTYVHIPLDIHTEVELPGHGLCIYLDLVDTANWLSKLVRSSTLWFNLTEMSPSFWVDSRNCFARKQGPDYDCNK